MPGCDVGQRVVQFGCKCGGQCSDQCGGQDGTRCDDQRDDQCDARYRDERDDQKDEQNDVQYDDQYDNQGACLSVTQDWRPTATLERLRFMAGLRADVRAWMERGKLLEVVTPTLSAAAPGELHLQSYTSMSRGETRYLQTSPEFPMKRFIAAEGVDCYQLASVFRAGERGRLHNPEFTMLEWYRVGADLPALMRDVEDLLGTLWASNDDTLPSMPRLSCSELVEAELGAGACAMSRHEPFVDVGQVRAHFERHGRSFPASVGDDADAAFDLLMDEFVLPALPRDYPVFMQGWPPSRAALARIAPDEHGRDVAVRFEVYLGTLELANGYHELTDAVEQRQRFESDIDQRRRRGIEAPPMDERLLAALDAGLPDCAGVAVGLERLAMAMLGADSIDEVIAFPAERA